MVVELEEQVQCHGRTKSSKNPIQERASSLSLGSLGYVPRGKTVEDPYTHKRCLSNESKMVQSDSRRYAGKDFEDQ